MLAYPSGPMSEAGAFLRSVPHEPSDPDAPDLDGLRSVRAVLEMLPVGVTIVEVEGDRAPRILTSNSAHDRIVGGNAHAQGPIDEQSFQLFLANRASATPASELPGPHAARTGETVHGAEVRVLRPDGGWRLLSVSAAPIPRTDASSPRRAIAVMLDVTEQRKTEQQLASSENFLRTVLETSLDGFWIVDQEGRLLDVNPAYCAMSGYGRVELLGMRIPQLEAGETPEETAANIRRIRAVGGGRFERRQRRKDGSILHVDVSVTLVGGPNGAMVCFLRDITERKAMEEALRASEGWHRQAVDALPILVWTARPDGYVEFANEQWRDFSGQTLDQVTGSGWMAVVHPEDLERTLAAFEAAVARGEYQVEQRLRRHDGEYRWFLAKGHLLRDGAGNPVRWYGVNLEIHDRKEAEAALRESEAGYRGLVDNLNAGVVVHAPDTSILLGNAKASQILGLSQDQLLGKVAVDPGWCFVREDGTAMPVDEYPIARVLATRRPVVNVVAGIRRPATDDMAWVLVSGSPVFGEYGHLLQVVVTFIDISRRKEAEEALRKSQAKLAVASRLAAMGTLVSGVAHEINNPLAGTLSAQALALDDVRSIRDLVTGTAPIDREAASGILRGAVEALEDAQLGAERVSRIVKDMTAFGRPDARRARMRLVDAVGYAMRCLPASMAARASVHVEDRGAPDVLGSVGQLEQVVEALVTNAAQAMPAGRTGRIVISCAPGSEGMARLEVADDGSGMSPKTLERVFDPFFTTRPVGEERGTGLGLAICQAIVTAHGGTLVATSQAGQGSVFRVEIPAAPERA